MRNDTLQWFERLTALHYSLIRKAVATEGLQSIHFEILQYLSICNHYSNTAQALSEYLGNTKGSISQSLKFLEEQKYISRKADIKDKRYARLHLTASGQECLKRMTDNGKIMPPAPLNNAPTVRAEMQEMLHQWQKQQGMKGFSLCETCRFNQKLSDGGFRCGLTGDTLSLEDTGKICREHEFAE